METPDLLFASPAFHIYFDTHLATVTSLDSWASENLFRRGALHEKCYQAVSFRFEQHTRSDSSQCEVLPYQLQNDLQGILTTMATFVQLGKRFQ